MKFKIMRLNTILLSSILAIFSSSDKQSASQIENNKSITIGDTVSETADSILVIFQDRNNNYWFGSNGHGVYRYVPSASVKTGSKTFTHFSTEDGLSGNEVWEIKEDKWGNIFFNSWQGISKFDGQRFSTLSVTESSFSDNKWKSSPDDLWFAGNQETNGPYRYDGKTLYHLAFPKHYLADEFYAGLPNPPYNPYQVYTIYKDRKGNIWFGTSTFGACRYDPSVSGEKSLSWLYEDHLTHIGRDGSFGIRSILEDKEGEFWFCNTTYRYNIYPGNSSDSYREGNRLINYKREKGIEVSKDRHGVDIIYYMSIVEDNTGDLWMVTYSGGVWRYDGKNITHYAVKDGSKDITLFSIYKDNHGDLWLGTHVAGAYKFNGKTFEKFG